MLLVLGVLSVFKYVHRKGSKQVNTGGTSANGQSLVEPTEVNVARYRHRALPIRKKLWD